MSYMSEPTDPVTVPWRGSALQAERRGIPSRFDTTLATQLTDDLFVGGVINGLRLPDDYRSVVSLYPWERYRVGPSTSVLEIPAYDSTDQPSWQWVADAARTVNESLDRGDKTLVHCQAGINRSALVAGVVLFARGVVGSGDAAIELLREKRSPVCLCNETLETYLGGIER